jgi:hypothetical protein
MVAVQHVVSLLLGLFGLAPVFGQVMYSLVATEYNTTGFGSSVVASQCGLVLVGQPNYGKLYYAFILTNICVTSLLCRSCKGLQRPRNPGSNHYGPSE